MQRSESLASLGAALAKAQSSILGAVKDSTNPFFNSRYADLASVWDACRPSLTMNGLSVIQAPTITTVGEPHLETVTSQKGEKRTVLRAVTHVSVATMLLHSSGEWVSTEISSIVSSADPQTIGMATTYLRRYGLAALVGIPQIDDDAETLTHPKPEARKATPESLPPSVQPASALTLTDIQQTRLKGLMQQHGIKAKEVRDLLQTSTRFGYLIKSAADIRQVDYDAICEWVIAGGR